MSGSFTITASSVMKRYQRRVLFRGVDWTGNPGDSLAVTGANGSGKSTLLQVLAGLRAPTKGGVSWQRDGLPVEKHEIHDYTGFCSPLVNPYEGLTGMENLRFVSRLKDPERELDMFHEFQLEGYENRPVRQYSSGMKQRLKLLCSMINNPTLLMLDEPGSNLDRRGKDFIYSYIDKVRNGRIIIIATNEPEEAGLCSGRIDLGK
jgi:heme exporter protein A